MPKLFDGSNSGRRAAYSHYLDYVDFYNHNNGFVYSFNLSLKSYNNCKKEKIEVIDSIIIPDINNTQEVTKLLFKNSNITNDIGSEQCSFDSENQFAFFSNHNIFINNKRYNIYITLPSNMNEDSVGYYLHINSEIDFKHYSNESIIFIAIDSLY